MTRQQKEFRKLADTWRELRGIIYLAPPPGGAEVIRIDVRTNRKGLDNDEHSQMAFDLGSD
jgi:hypothetical protein